LTGVAKENLDMMFTKLIIQGDSPLNLGESTYFHDFMLQVSKGSYKGAPERLFSSVGLVKSDLRGRLLDSTLIDVMNDTHTHIHRDIHTLVRYRKDHTKELLRDSSAVIASLTHTCHCH
jgi:hypothetical protein